MEDPVLPGPAFHQQIQPRRRAPEHESDVCRGQHHTLGFAGRARCVDDRHRIGVGHLRRSSAISSTPADEDFIKKKMRRRSAKRPASSAGFHRAAPHRRSRPATAASFIMATNSAGPAASTAEPQSTPRPWPPDPSPPSGCCWQPAMPQRSPFFSPLTRETSAPCAINSSSSSPVTPVTWPSRISCSTVVSAAASSCENISSRNVMACNRTAGGLNCTRPPTAADERSWAAGNPPSSTRLVRVGNSGYRRCTSSSK